MLTKLTLKNFKSFEYAEFDLGPVTTLIGTNASGKSNVRDALRILHGIARGYTLAEAIGEKWEHGVPIWKGIRGGTREMVYYGSRDRVCEIGVDFSFVISREYAEYYRFAAAGQVLHGSYKIGIGIDGANFKPKVYSESFEIIGVSGAFYETKTNSVKGNTIHVIRQSENGLKQEDFQNNIPILSQLNFSEFILTMELHFGSMQFLKLLDKMRFLDVSPDAMRQPSIPGQTILSDRGENLSSVLHAICENPDDKKVLLEWMKELTPQDVTDFSFSEDQQGKVLLGLQEGDGRVISAYSASDGTLRFLAMIAALLSPEPARLYFFEEVENGIHPSRLHLLMQLIEERSTTDNGQLIMSTHSPQLLSYLSERSQENASLIYRPSFSKSSHAVPILKVPHINEALQTQDVSEIHASGWFENVMEFMEGDEGEEREA